MRSRWKGSVWVCGLGILGAPAVVQSAVVYRTTGVACTLDSPGLGVASFKANSGLSYTSSSEVLPSIACSVPTGEETFLPTTLTQVNVRYHFEGGATVTGRIVFHDYDSPDYVECGEDADTFTTTGYRTLEIAKSCSSSTYESNWAVVAEVEPTGMSVPETLNVKLVSVYD